MLTRLRWVSGARPLPGKHQVRMGWPAKEKESQARRTAEWMKHNLFLLTLTATLR